jgi:hypothetical protein
VCATTVLDKVVLGLDKGQNTAVHVPKALCEVGDRMVEPVRAVAVVDRRAVVAEAGAGAN